MSNEMDAAQMSFYAAFLTDEAVRSPRTPISGERIVIVLGEDEGGRSLELSVLLRKSTPPGTLACYALNEALPLNDPKRLGFWPYARIKRMGANVFQIAIEHREFSAGSGDLGVEPAPKPKKQTAYCSFCGASYPQTGSLVEGAGADAAGGIFICRKCAELSLDIFNQKPTAGDSDAP